jgi:hypothetical protein
MSDVVKKIDNERLRARRRKLLEILNKIVSGAINHEEYDIDKLYSLYESVRNQRHGGPRKEYVSPAERGTYNYGYMTISEMEAGNPNIF